MNNSKERDEALKEVKLGAILPGYRTDRAIRQRVVDEQYHLTARKEARETEMRRSRAVNAKCSPDEVIAAETEGRKVGRLLSAGLFAGKRRVRR